MSRPPGVAGDWVSKKMDARNKSRRGHDLEAQEHISGAATVSRDNDDHVSNAQRGPALPDLRTELPRTAHEVAGQKDSIAPYLARDDSTPLPKPKPELRRRTTKRLVRKPTRARQHLPGPAVVDGWRGDGDPVSEAAAAHAAEEAARRKYNGPSREPSPVVHGVPTNLKIAKRDVVPVPPSRGAPVNEWGRFMKGDDHRLPTAPGPAKPAPPHEPVIPFDGPLPPMRPSTNQPRRPKTNASSGAPRKKKYKKARFADDERRKTAAGGLAPRHGGIGGTGEGLHYGTGRMSTAASRLNEADSDRLNRRDAAHRHVRDVEDHLRLGTGASRLDTAASSRLDTAASSRLDTAASSRLDTAASSRLDTAASYRLDTAASNASSYMVTRDEHDRLATARPPGTGQRPPLFRNFPAGVSPRTLTAPGANYGVDGTHSIMR